MADDHLTDEQKVAMIRNVAAGGGGAAPQAAVRLARAWGREEGLRIIDIAQNEMAAELSAALSAPEDCRRPGCNCLHRHDAGPVDRPVAAE